MTPEERENLIEFIFAPTVEFPWLRGEQLMGLYLPGQTYNCSRQPVHDDLRAQCEQWVAEGKILVHPLAYGQRFVMTQTS